MADQETNRREFLKRAALIAGGSMALPAALAAKSPKARSTTSAMARSVSCGSRPQLASASLSAVVTRRSIPPRKRCTRLMLSAAFGGLSNPNKFRCWTKTGRGESITESFKPLLAYPYRFHVVDCRVQSAGPSRSAQRAARVKEQAHVKR